MLGRVRWHYNGRAFAQTVLLFVIKRLHERLDAAERAAKRQAAPFSKGGPKERPKKAGRKKGEKHGKHGHRPPPDEDKIDEVLEGSLPCECPHCHGAVEARQTRTNG